jgi:hypothetical protein
VTRKRGIGKKQPTNMTRLQILFFLRQGQKTTTEIREYLKDTSGITEPKGVRLHLARLYDDGYLSKKSKIGIGVVWEWKKTHTSFKKIVNLFYEKFETIYDMINEEPVEFRGSEIAFENQLVIAKFVKSFSPVYHVTLRWYKTNYTKSFLNEKTIEYFVNDAYDKVKKSPKMKNISKIEFEKIPRTILVKLMYYSPTLVQYIVNLDEKSKQLIQNYDKKILLSGTKKDIILMPIKDIFIEHHEHHGNYPSLSYGIQEDKLAKTIQLNLTMQIPENLGEDKIANS